MVYATIGGNICNASPCGDTLSPLVALEASFVLQSRTGKRTVPAERFFTGPKKTVELVGKKNVDKGYLKELEETVRPAMVICIQWMTDRPVIEGNYLLVVGARRVNAILQPTLVCPELAPLHRHFLVACAAPVSSVPPLDAEKEIALCMEDLRELFPGFDQHSKILLVSTFRGDWPGFHSWPGYGMGPKTPIVNLYNVGDGVSPSGTVALPSTVLSARLVVEDIQSRIQPTA